ncbi:penicillin-binding protein activator [Morganella morganii]|uniref:penicillin-binding protein activator n=1 Tax=Morganella morganii TaxID=582 RepID=UPI001BDB63D9|nr:penicillin-binding protein activator [Morganella morganii]ELA7709604.1 penicillin-binding protein activator [Morganella morganii]MBT0308771.1 penicillin-binding protein activator [Morganella morganii subsp. morganii]HCR3554056.1 penicillin-binding protein activator [Morganella morganii]HCR3759067.1 penicillin-binding protein activator [Morganella morganii]HCT5324288.1 penicillin-binding protein activator [Morganella morganii]
MFSLTLSRYRRQLLCTALFSTLVISGCTLENRHAGTAGKGQPETQVQQYQKIIDAAAGKPSVDAIRAYIAQEPLLTDPDAHQQNIDETWLMLTRFTPEERNNIQVNADESVLQGWVDLLILYQNNQQDLKALSAALGDWQIRYPDNPAAKSLPQDLIQTLSSTYGQTGKNARVALFLPLSGQAKLMGDAIRQGFTDAQNGAVYSTGYRVTDVPATQPVSAVPAQTPLSPADPDKDITTPDVTNGAPSNDSTADGATAASPVSAPQALPYSGESRTVTDVKIYDTDSKPLATLLAQAQADGMDLIVGPLLKGDVATLATANTPLNILALNELDTPIARPNVCYFSLSPEDEARNAAQFIRQDNKTAPLVLTPDNSFGRRIAQSFADEWQKNGGGVVLHQTFSGNPDSSLSLTGVPVQPSSSAAAQPDGSVVQPQPVSGGVDSVYIIATSDQLIYIKPALEFATSARGGPAFYASSRSNKAGTGKDFQFEMEGLKLTDIPLIAGGNPQLLSQAAGKFGNDYTRVRLYAMGMDAWRLANQFGDMQRHTLRMNGASGDITVTDNCTVYRHLPWLEFKQGNLAPLGAAN